MRQCFCGCSSRLIIGSLIAQNIRDVLFNTLQITATAGVSHNKLLAKLIGSTHKPNQQTTIFPTSVSDYMSSIQSLRDIPGIGFSTFTKLQRLGINDIIKLQESGESYLRTNLGVSLAEQLKNLSFGIDNNPVKATEKTKSIGAEDGFSSITSISEITHKMRILLKRIWKLIVKDGRTPSTLKLTVRKAVQTTESNFTSTSSSRSFSERSCRQVSFEASFLRTSSNIVKVLDTNHEQRLIAIGMSLLEKIVPINRDRLNFDIPVTLLGMSFSSFLEDKGSNKKGLQGTVGIRTSSISTISSPMLQFPRKLISAESSLSSTNKGNAITESKQSWQSTLDDENYLRKSQSPAKRNRASPLLTIQSSPAPALSCPSSVDIEFFSSMPEDIKVELISAHSSNDIHNPSSTRSNVSEPKKRKTSTTTTTQAKSKICLDKIPTLHNYFQRKNS